MATNIACMAYGIKNKSVLKSFVYQTDFVQLTVLIILVNIRINWLSNDSARIKLMKNLKSVYGCSYDTILFLT